ncbi:Six-hairpin glycosidase-like protein [Aspergillus foveolatus]|uniref:Six-hairpin glycosidase-like protein n=1 Tax=Aspergillus foveolatus TaxID=210207 RepID=UPI003CCCDD3D
MSMICISHANGLWKRRDAMEGRRTRAHISDVILKVHRAITLEAGAAKMSPLYRFVVILLAACVAVVDGPDAIQIEAKYSEARSGLDEPFADGPWTFSNGLANSFRVETFNITRPGHIESFFQQGGQRWQRLRLLNDDTTVRLCGVGIRSLNERTEVEQLPGYFASSNPLYNEIWALGARTVQQACIEKGTAPTTWEVTPDGVLLRGQQSAQSALGASLANYTMTFKTKIIQGEWLHMSTKITPKGYIVSINNETTIDVPLNELHLVTNAQFSAGSAYAGSWGFAPYQDQLAYVKDVAVHSRNGTLLYHNAMKDESVLEEYGVSTNPASVCLDGAKRDRLVWSGDFAHTQRIISASTNRSDLIKGTLEFILDRQEESGPSTGLFAMSPGMGHAAKYASVYKSYGLLDYQMLFLNSLARYYLDCADIKFIHDNGTAASALLVYTLTRMAEVAELMGKPDTASRWKERATDLSFAVNQQLWNKSLGTYSSTNSSQADSSIAALSNLRLGIGYKTTSHTASDPSTNLSPNLSGFLLEALFKHARSQQYHAATVEAIDVLLNGLWAAMTDKDEYYTGTSWEYLYPDGRPGLDLFTSLAHPWGGAPTYVLTEYLLGIQPTSPGFIEWAFRPVITGMGLSWVEGRVPTPRGSINTGWVVENGTEISVWLTIESSRKIVVKAVSMWMFEVGSARTSQCL